MSATKTTHPLWNRTTLLFGVFVFFLSFLTYFHNYAYPQAVFWDENYHIASAQKYLHGTFLMEQHPPLGKLLIALGEKIIHPNVKTDQFLGTDYGTEFGSNFSFAGYRFFSALLSWWAAPLFFLIFLLITRNAIFAAFLSFFYIFDNAMIVHNRGAMLEGPLVFFNVAMIALFFLLKEYKDNKRLFMIYSILFGVSFACIVTTKVLGLLFILLIPAFLLLLWPDWKKMLKHLGWFFLGFIVMYVAVWQTHFALVSKVNPALPDQGYYQASPEYKKILAEKKNTSLLSFPVMIRDSLKYVTFYNKGAPRLDLCKPDENGSPWYFWPFGARSINYRWETPDSKAYRYLYLQANPMTWWVSALAVFVAVCLLLGSVIAPRKEPMKHPYLILVFVGMYASFFVGVSGIERVLYLYHYFTALILAFVVVGLVFMEIKQVWKYQLTEYRQTAILMILAGLIFASYQFYRPLSYYEPLTREQFEQRNIFGLWELTCVNCDKVSPLSVPRSCPQQ